MKEVYLKYKLVGDTERDNLEKTDLETYQMYKEYKRYRKYKQYKECKENVFGD